MARLRYLSGVVTLELDQSKCNGCAVCLTVCPHAVLAMDNGLAEIVDRDACMECGACMLNCAADALKVEAGVGCVTAIIKGAIGGTEASCGCDDGCCG